ncbi:MAG: DUF4920 domain-containing protein [Bacteroidia bacterium]|jgi:hypothetical protein|nr:DUF4920 domain-containing protein [Bacteroidia bacterium]
MKKFLLAVLVCGAFTACNNSAAEDKKPVGDTTVSYFGDTITADGAIQASQLLAQIAGKDSMQVKLEGTIEEVCQKKGCWMKLQLDSANEMRVKFKDYAFFVPKDAGGKKVIVEGWAYADSLSVEELRHYAEDAGDSKEEIEKITKPEAEYTFMARGVIIRK